MSADVKNQLQLNTCTYVIKLISSVINKTIPPEKTTDLEWKDIIETAKSHCILNIVAYAVENLKNKPDEYTNKFLKEFKMQKIVLEAQQEIEASDAMQKLTDMEVCHMPLKGYEIKNLYPSPDMRTMGDIDILIEADRCNEVVEEFKKDGFSFCGEGDLHSNVERGNAYIEFHRTMVDEHFTVLNDYFGDGFKRAKKCDGYAYRYELSKEDLYIFLIAHIAKHYRNGGTGIRTMLDLYIYRRAFPNLNNEYISSEMKKIGLDKFMQIIEEISKKWFSTGFDGKYSNVSAYIALNGLYGLPEVNFFSSFILENDNKQGFEANRRTWILHEFFPKREIMSIRYPILNRAKWLTPLFWIVRAIDTLIHQPKNIKGRVEDSIDILKIDSNVVDIQKQSEIEKL